MNTGKMTLIAVVIFFSFLAYRADAQEVCTEGNPVLRPQYTVGDSWDLSGNNGESRIEFQRYERDISVHKRTRGNKIDYIYHSPNGNTVKILDSSGRNTLTNYGEKPLLQFPLFKGKTWSGTYEIESKSISTGKSLGMMTKKIEVVVVGPEKVSVAGEIMPTCRLEAKSYVLSGRGEQRETYWYAPKAKRVVKYDSTSTSGESVSYELKTYALGRGGEVAEK